MGAGWVSVSTNGWQPFGLGGCSQPGPWRRGPCGAQAALLTTAPPQGLKKRWNTLAVAAICQVANANALRAWGSLLARLASGAALLGGER